MAGVKPAKYLDGQVIILLDVKRFKELFYRSRWYADEPFTLWATLFLVQTNCLGVVMIDLIFVHTNY